MVSDAPAQTRPVEDQAPAVAVDQDGLSPVPAPASTPVPATGIESASESYDLSSPDGIRNAVEKNEALRNYLTKERLDAENSAKQRLQNEMRREQGSVERARAYQDLLASKYGVELADEDARELPGYVRANEDYVRTELNKAYAEATTKHFSLEESEAFKLALAAVESDPKAYSDLTSQLIEAVHAKGKTDALAGLTPEQAAEHPTVKSIVDSLVAARLEAEMQAAQIEANQLPQAPNTPSGGAMPSAEATVQNIIDMPEAKRMEYLADLALTNPEEFERLEALLMAAG